MRRLYITYRCAAALLCLGLPASAAFAADPLFAYRGGQLGDSLGAVRNAVAGKFPRQEERALEDVITVLATDNEGAKRYSCPVSAPPARAANCLQARFIHWPGEGGLKLTIITVAQSFSSPVPVSDILEKLRSAFGAPQRTYEGAEVADDVMPPKNDDLVLVWGGRKIPAPPYRPSSIIAEDYSVIGGKYITALVHMRGRVVSGYQLVIADSDRAVSTLKHWKTRREQGEANQTREHIDSIKF